MISFLDLSYASLVGCYIYCINGLAEIRIEIMGVLFALIYVLVPLSLIYCLANRRRESIEETRKFIKKDILAQKSIEADRKKRELHPTVIVDDDEEDVDPALLAAVEESKRVFGYESPEEWEELQRKRGGKRKKGSRKRETEQTDADTFVMPSDKTVIEALDWDLKHYKRIVVPEGVTEIGYAAFQGLELLEEIQLPSTLRIIRNEAFAKCYRLRKVVIPDGVTHIMEFAFFRCNSLESIVIPEKVRVLSAGVFAECCNLKQVQLPQNLREIGDFCFYACYELTGIEIPATVRNIASGAFYKCEELDTIVLPEGMTTIETALFACCYNLREVHIGSHVSKIEYCAFADCSSLESLAIPRSVKNVEAGAFGGCTALKELKTSNSFKLLNNIFEKNDMDDFFNIDFFYDNYSVRDIN